jgi:hypothetical protein
LAGIVVAEMALSSVYQRDVGEDKSGRRAATSSYYFDGVIDRKNKHTYDRYIDC